MQLYGAVRHAVQGFVAKDLQRGHGLDEMRVHLERPQIALVGLPETLERQAAHGLHVQVRIDGHPLQRLKPAQRPAERLPVLEMGEAAVEQVVAQAGAHAPAAHANPVDHAHAQIEAVARCAPQVVRGQAAVLETQLARHAVVHDGPVGAADAEAGIVALDDEGGRAGPARAGVVQGAHEDQVGVLGVGDVRLGAVHDPRVAVLFGARLHPQHVGAAPVFGNGIRGRCVAAHQGQEIFPLLLGREEHQHPVGPLGPRQQPLGHPDAVLINGFVHEEHVGQAEPAAADFCRHVQCVEAALGRAFADRALRGLDLRGEPPIRA